MILAGDTGGTKTVLALCDERGKLLHDSMFPCAAYPSLEAIVDQFLDQHGDPKLSGAGFGVAGPVTGHTAKITNLPWTIDARVLSERLGGIPVALLNDLQATALGALVLPSDAFAELQAGAVPEHATIAVLAPGTGLGEAVLVHDGHRYRALPSEGGHADFAPTSDEQIELLRYLRARYGGHVSYERVLSGAGIGDLYDFVRTTSGTPEPAWLADQIASGDRNAAIAAAAIESTDPVCVHALELFADILGAEAGNMALRTLATGGVVIGGGIPPKVLPALRRHAVGSRAGLIERFNDKGRFSAWTRALSVRVTLDPKAALYGAAHHVITSKDQRS